MPAVRASPLTLDAVPVLLRTIGHCPPLSELMAQARAADLPIDLPLDAPLDDFGAIDLSLHVAPTPDATPPLPGVDYAGMSSGQRRAFLNWAATPEAPAPPAFRRLYIAALEAHLLDTPSLRQRATGQLVGLGMVDTWRADPFRQHALLLALWLEQRGEMIAGWLRTGQVIPALVGIVLGHMALLNTPLDADGLSVILTRWGITHTEPDPELLKLRLASLTSSLGQDPLSYALATLEPNARAPKPWRMAHRGLKPALPQPDLRPALEPPLRDMLSVPFHATSADATEESPDDDDGDDATGQTGWNLILEFGHTRSEFLEPVLRLCRRLPGFTQILDEDRRMIYRVTFRKSEMRRFWRIWDFAQSWTSTRVYLNGQELEHWKIWPYSQYLR